ncbi:DUF4123 domain-containing protein [Billgrantia lactosivorans]|uniref:DUF4123 domain-containing protein n=1 Tax=Billgrantia lactosivorans TaxID=2185141 RepID=UPI000DAD1506|nr:DUF4123 domain-containing protein [Halomonas lactosivorans]
MGEPGRITHVLVDGVRYPDALRRLYSRDDLVEIVPLYLLTRFKDVAAEGPILVAPKGRRFVDEILAEGEGELTRAMSLIASAATTEELVDHLLGFVEIEVDGAQRLLRFADPLVLRHWLASYGESAPADVMGPIDTWRVAQWAPAWNKHEGPVWRTFEVEAGQAPSDDQLVRSPHHFASPQLDALDAVARWQFKERLAEYFERHAGEAWSRLAVERRGDWLESRLNESLAWGAQTERQLAIWVELSLHGGAGFMTAPTGPYARWMAQDPSRSRLPQQQQLYELDAWCRSTEGTQEANNETTRKSHHV